MLELISLNIEGRRHYERILPFLEKENPDIICLQEAPKGLQLELMRLGYKTTFAPMTIREYQTETFTEGVIFASRYPYEDEVEYYYKSANEIVPARRRVPETYAHPVIISTFKAGNETYTIATTHVMVTMDGHSDEHQQTGITKLLNILERHNPLVVCGDFNMPRSINTNYTAFTSKYTDTVPKSFKSSMDKQHHKLANNPDLKEPIFDSYMVDYIFTQAPFVAHDVHLQFGLSDHAAVIGKISRN